MSEAEVVPPEITRELRWLVDPDDPEVHRAVLAQPDFVIPVIGSGISAPVGYPAGQDLAAELVRVGQRAGLDNSELAFPDPRSLAEVLISRGVIDRDALLRFVGDIYGRAPTCTSHTIDALLRIRSRRVVTLNYDRSLEARADELGITCESLVLAIEASRVLQVLGADSNKDELVIIHAHGVASDPSTIVLDGQGYSDLIAAPYVADCFRTLLINSRLLFMGTRLDELDLLHELIRLRILNKHHLLVTSRAAADELLTAGRSPLVSQTYMVLVRGYDAHDDLLPLVDLLCPAPEGEPAAPAVEGPVFATVDLAAPPVYVETLMVEKRDPEQDDFLASYLVALGIESPVTLEQIAAVGTRTLIQGLPGSGKTTLLHQIGLRLHPNVVALRLHAPQLDLVGHPELLLPRWFDTASAFRGGEVRDPARLGTDVFHFLIDGLDEVPYPQQAQAAARIIEVAAANPVHSFTVASRTIPAVEEFARPEWVRVGLAQTSNWRQAYLERRGVTWDELVQAAPLLKDLRGLLDLPFFLSQTVDLYTQDSLAEAADMLSLVSRFVDAALREVEETLPASAVRRWLQQLALGMTLASRSEVTIQEIATSLPSELLAYGDATAVADRFVAGRLLSSSGERRYRFVHRIFGEALAAEALIDVDPEETGVLDVAAPAVSDLICGVRSDWLVTITLVAATSEDWRRALARRDPLAAARAIPSDAPAKERVDAARFIWDQYVEWRIWISDYHRMTIVEDESVLARLLATEGLQELHAEIRAAVSSDVRETIGNAIRVLATLGDRTIEPQLRQIIETNDDYVLRRMAALAARDLKLDALFYLIAHRALHAAESTEAQDMTYAALDLARSLDLTALALRAARQGGEGSSILVHAIQGRISVTDELAVLRAWASHRPQPLTTERERVVQLLPRLPLEDPEIAESVIFVAGSWRIEADQVKELIRQHEDAAIAAVIELERLNAVHLFQLRWILEHVSLERLIAADVPETMIDEKRALEEWKRRRGE